MLKKINKQKIKNWIDKKNLSAYPANYELDNKDIHLYYNSKDLKRNDEKDY